jgi:hypothetical protein
MSIDLSKETYVVTTPVCGMCGEQGTVEVPAIGFLEWNFGKLVQEAFPNVDVSIREQLISGTHPKCWNVMTGGQ